MADQTAMTNRSTDEKPDTDDPHETREGKKMKHRSSRRVNVLYSVLLLLFVATFHCAQDVQVFFLLLLLLFAPLHLRIVNRGLFHTLCQPSWSSSNPFIYIYFYVCNVYAWRQSVFSFLSSISFRLLRLWAHCFVVWLPVLSFCLFLNSVARTNVCFSLFLERMHSAMIKTCFTNRTNNEWRRRRNSEKKKLNTSAIVNRKYVLFWIE